MFVVTKVLVISPNVSFSLTVRQLEKRGRLEVMTFTSGHNALEHLAQHPQDVALLDFNISDLPVTEMLRRLRQMQPDILVVAGPESLAEASRKALGLQAVLPIPLPARELEALLLKVVGRSLPATDTQPTRTPAPEPSPDSVSLELRWSDDEETGEAKLEASFQGQAMETGETESEVFKRLAAEEPPMPDFAENGTVSDLVIPLSDEKKLRQVLASINEELEKADSEPPRQPQQVRAIPAMLILEGFSDDSTPLNGFSITSFLQRIDEQLPPGEPRIMPLPSWIEEQQRYVREPDFLPPDFMPEAEPMEYTASTTVPSSAQVIEPDPSSMVTDQIEVQPALRPKPAPPSTIPEMPTPLIPEAESPVEAAPEAAEEKLSEESDHAEWQPPYPDDVTIPHEASRTVALSETREPSEMTQPNPTIRPPVKAYESISTTISPVSMRVEQSFIDADAEPYIAQTALTMTQVSLELTAEATLLARDGQIVAYAGNLPYEDVEEISDQIRNDWDNGNLIERMRFIRLNSTGKDYLLYSLRTRSGDFTLSMIFGGRLPVGVIRRQAGRLADALAAVPEPDSAEEGAALAPDGLEIQGERVVEDDGILRSPFTYLWMLRDPEMVLDLQMAQTLMQGLDHYLMDEKWRIHSMKANPRYMLIFADVPDEGSGHSRIRDLMAESERILRENFTEMLPDDLLWSDSFLVLSPGRELDQAEIDRFIDFVAG